MIDIDGTHGEGGGQLVRTAVAVAAARGVPIRIVGMRARRAVPGLAAQHVAAVRAVAALCDAQVDGLALRSTALTFRPGRLHGGEFEIDVGTAGSITLVLQALLPAALASGERVRARVRGGTDVRAAPALDYTRHVLLPLLAHLGARSAIEVVRRGYYPKGGGEVRLTLEPVARLAPLRAEHTGTRGRVQVHAHVAHLPRHIAERMVAAARDELAPELEPHATIEVCDPARAAGPGGAIVLAAETAHTTLGASQVAERGVPAERLGRHAAQALGRDLHAGATLDWHATDQLLALLALADGPSVFRAAGISSHAATAIWLLQQLTPVRFERRPAAAGTMVHIRP